MQTLKFALTVAAAQAIEENFGQFMEFTAKHGKSYSTMEELTMRHERWNRVEAHIKEHNSTNYQVGHNQFSDFTEAEYKGLLGYKPMKKAPQPHVEVNATMLKDIPTSVDWREHNAVNPIKN